jgi:hypothetical protein
MLFFLFLFPDALHQRTKFHDLHDLQGTSRGHRTAPVKLPRREKTCTTRFTPTIAITQACRLPACREYVAACTPAPPPCTLYPCMPAPPPSLPSTMHAGAAGLYPARAGTAALHPRPARRCRRPARRERDAASAAPAVRRQVHCTGPSLQTDRWLPRVCLGISSCSLCEGPRGCRIISQYSW